MFKSLSAKNCMNCKCRKSENVSVITHAQRYSYYKQRHFHTYVHKACLHTRAYTHLQTTHLHSSHIHSLSAQQVWHFAPNVIFWPISGIIALLIFRPHQCLTGLRIDVDAGISPHWVSTCPFQPTHQTKAVSPSESLLLDYNWAQLWFLWWTKTANNDFSDSI